MKTHSFSNRLLAMLLSLVMVLGMVPASVLAAEVPEVQETTAETTEEVPEEEIPEVPVEESTEAAVVETTEALVEEPTEAPVEEPTEAPAEEPTKAPVEEPTEAPVEEDDFFIQGEADDFFMEEAPVVAAAAQPVLTMGEYEVPVVELKSGAPIPAIAQAFQKGFGENIRVNVDREGIMTATLRPQHMSPSIGNIAYHCNILKIRANGVEATYTQMQTQTVTSTFGSADTQEIECPLEAVLVLPAYDAQKDGYPLEMTVDFMNGLKGSMDTDNWMDVTLKLNLADARQISGPSKEDIQAAAAVDAQIEALQDITLASAYNVAQAREAYEALTESQKELVTRLDDLVAAEQIILDLKTPVFTAPEDGFYIASATMLHEYKEQNSMCNVMFDARADIAVKDGMATITILVANPVPGFPDQGVDGTVKDVSIDYGGKLYKFESQLGTDAMMTAKETQALFGFVQGEQYPAQVLTVTIPAQAIGEDTRLTTHAYVNVVMMNNETFRLNLTDLHVNPDAEAAAAVDAKIDALKEITLGSAYNIAKAREAYEALTDAQKAYVTKLDVLEAAEQTLLELKTPVFPVPADGLYTANATMLHEYKEQPSMCNVMFDAKATITVKDGMATMTLLVANPVPGFPDQGVDGTVKDVSIDYGGKLYKFESQLGTDAMMTAKETQSLFGFVQGEQYPAQVLTVTIPAQAIGEDTRLVTNAYVNVVMMSSQTFRINLTGLELDPDVAAAAAVDALIENIGTVTRASRTAIVKARTEYDALTETQKALVTKLNVLEAAEAAFEQLLNPEFPAPANGRYTASVRIMHEAKDQPSMSDSMFDARADIVVKDDLATITLRVANPVPAHPEQGADGSVKDMFIDYKDEKYLFDSQVNTGAKMTAKQTNSIFGVKAGSRYSAQILTVVVPSVAIGEGTSLRAGGYVNVVMNSDIKFRIELTNLTKLDIDNPFVDLSENAYYYVPVLWAVNNGITKGMDDTHFSPDLTCTRSQIVTFLWTAAGKPEPKTVENPFVDITSDQYFYKAVLWAVENKITGGMDATHFEPYQPCTRAQAVTFIWSANNKPAAETEVNPFRDVSEKAYYYEAVLWAVENHITTGFNDTQFAPDTACTRCQIVQFLWSNAGRPGI